MVPLLGSSSLAFYMLLYSTEQIKSRATNFVWIFHSTSYDSKHLIAIILRWIMMLPIISSWSIKWCTSEAVRCGGRHCSLRYGILIINVWMMMMRYCELKMNVIAIQLSLIWRYNWILMFELCQALAEKEY